MGARQIPFGTVDEVRARVATLGQSGYRAVAGRGDVVVLHRAAR